MRQAPADPFQKGIDFRAFLLNALLILPPAFLYSMKTDMPHIILITTAILLICLFKSLLCHGGAGPDGGSGYGGHGG